MGAFSFTGNIMKDNQLEVGDKLIYSKWSSHTIATIDRVTDKRAYCGSTAFIREVKNGNLRELGRERWATQSFSLFDQESWTTLQKQAKAVALRNKLLNQLETIRRQMVDRASDTEVIALLHAVEAFKASTEATA